MTRHDPEIEELREKVHCAVVLERTPPCWKLDRREGTKLSLKYRRAKGEIVIVNHGGRGWWDPTSDATGESGAKVYTRLTGARFTSIVSTQIRDNCETSPGNGFMRSLT